MAVILSTQVSGPFKKNSIVLNNLKPSSVYCLQIETQLTVKVGNTCPPRSSFSNVSCHETTENSKAYLHLSVMCCENASPEMVKTGRLRGGRKAGCVGWQAVGAERPKSAYLKV